MDWNLLLTLICPIMMLFCMKGMFGGHKHQDEKSDTGRPLMSQQDIQSLHSKMAELAEQNTYLVKEVQSLRETVAVLKGGNEQH